MKVKISDLIGYEKDLNIGGKESGVILKADKTSLLAYKAKKQEIERINNLENEVQEIKFYLQEILKKLNG